MIGCMNESRKSMSLVTAKRQIHKTNGYPLQVCAELSFKDGLDVQV